MPAITIKPMGYSERAGDWHDAPLRWIVEGPGEELQKFSTRENARLYARCRKASPDFNTACRNYCNPT